MRVDRLTGRCKSGGFGSIRFVLLLGGVTFVAGCGGNGNGNGNSNTNDNEDVTPVFPANYESSYTVVRDCRPTVEHAAVGINGVIVDYIRVLANDAAAEAYMNDANPLPVGSIVIKEGYSGTNCSTEGTLLSITAMRKEQPGFDVDGDWHWQIVAPDRRVVENTKTTCIDCHSESACLARDYMCTVP